VSRRRRLKVPGKHQQQQLNGHDTHYNGALQKRPATTTTTTTIIITATTTTRTTTKQ